MLFSYKIIPYTLHFKSPAGTSRGVYHDHKVWYIVLRSGDNPEHIGVGECAPLHDLSCDALPEKEYVEIIEKACLELLNTGQINNTELRDYPSILFGFETAWMHFQRQDIRFWDTPFSRGEGGITINGLIWMGDYHSMYQQIKQKLEQGFECVKLKIGAIDFEQELSLLKYIRSHFSKKLLTLRVDANGAFSTGDVLEKLKRLSDFGLHSIEQPIGAGQWDEMAELVMKTPIPIALDEELIGINDQHEKVKLLNLINPQYIILKPTLHGGISGATEWIDLAKKSQIGWWITSALESNIGLNAIAQWCAYLNTSLPQGLGTGMLYTNNLSFPLEIRKDKLFFSSRFEIRNCLKMFYVQS